MINRSALLDQPSYRPRGRCTLRDAIFRRCVVLVSRLRSGCSSPKTPIAGAIGRKRARAATGIVDWVTGVCFLVRRQAFDAVGGFDDRYFMYVEEVDLCW